MTTLKCCCTVAKPLYDYENKKYIDLFLPIPVAEKIRAIHMGSERLLIKKNKIDPLCDNKLKVKVPFRYRRVMCKVTGKKGIYEAVQDDTVTVILKYCGTWSSDDYCGTAWKLEEINL